jgi:hypothetical protein
MQIIVSLLLLVGLTLVWVPLGIVSAGIVEIMTERRDARKKEVDGGDADAGDDKDEKQVDIKAKDKDRKADTTSKKTMKKLKKVKRAAGRHCKTCKCHLHSSTHTIATVSTSSVNGVASLSTPLLSSNVGVGDLSSPLVAAPAV